MSLTVYFEHNHVYEVYDGMTPPSCSCIRCGYNLQCQQVKVKWLYKLQQRIVDKCRSNGENMDWIKNIYDEPIQESIVVLCDRCAKKFQEGSDWRKWQSGRDDNDYTFSAYCDWNAHDKILDIISSVNDTDDEDTDDEDTDDE